MKREIKFRAWDKKRKEWYGSSNPDGLMWYGFSLFGECTLVEGMPPVNYLENLEISQFTGFLDKNGKEIYEGDIIKIHDEYDKIIVVKPPELFECDAFVVYGYKFCSGFFIENYYKVGLDRFYSYKPEVIGNIYENPEPLQ